jgi:hypothetical protein
VEVGHHGRKQNGDILAIAARAILEEILGGFDPVFSGVGIRFVDPAV